MHYIASMLKTISILTLVILGTLASAFATDASVYCKVDGKIYDVLADEEAYECRGAFLYESGDACFTGERTAAIEVLNGLQEAGYFDGTDGEYIRDAKYKGKYEIAYTAVDEANETETKATLSRCRSDFFRQ